MRIRRMALSFSLLCVAATAGLAGRLEAQGKGKAHDKGHSASPAHGKEAKKHRKISTDQAFSATREVLVKHGYEVVRIEDRGAIRIVHYRRGNMGRGRGKGPVETMIIRRLDERVVFEKAPPAVQIDINVRLDL